MAPHAPSTDTLVAPLTTAELVGLVPVPPSVVTPGQQGKNAMDIASCQATITALENRWQAWLISEYAYDLSPQIFDALYAASWVAQHTYDEAEMNYLFLAERTRNGVARYAEIVERRQPAIA